MSPVGRSIKDGPVSRDDYFSSMGVAASIVSSPALREFDFTHGVDGSLHDDQASTPLRLVPFDSSVGYDLAQLLRNPANSGHLSMTAHGYDARGMLKLESGQDIERLYKEQAQPGSLVRDYAEVIGPHYEPAQEHFRSGFEVIGGMRKTARSNAGRAHEITVFIDVAHTRQGYGTRAARLMLWGIFQHSKATQVSGYVRPENLSGIGLAERLEMPEVRRNKDGAIRFTITRAGFFRP